ncbi:hypothetical protein NDU88_003218 [Pleurodeles waltl]|uniref:Uncharacterized protein n=1 Tax=Pleurodeles waltl TaxID=8319 RepID=A0AAV7QC62_PLEWA|nr:hypothetical protein NDU88_003218 [Pleurodeles waltl]
MPRSPTSRIGFFSLFTKGAVPGGPRDSVAGTAGVGLLGTTPSQRCVNTSVKHFGGHYDLSGLFKRPLRLRETEYRHCRQYFCLPIMTFPLAQRKCHVNIAAGS